MLKRLICMSLFAAVAMADDGGTVKGKVIYQGEAPEREEVDVNKDKEVCGTHEIRKEDLIVHPKNKGLKNVVITLTAKKVEPEPKKDPAEYDQKGCVFTDHVLVIQEGRKVKFLNSDPVAHNVNTASVRNRRFNEMVGGGKDFVKEFKRKENIKVTCDIHPWMEGYIIVVDTPHFALTDENGEFEIKGIPPGEYKVKVWHETLKTIERKMKIDVEAGKTEKVEFKAEPK